MPPACVHELWRYPVKSMRGERLAQAHAGERGLQGDRRYALLDRETGKIASAKHPRLWGILLRCQVRTVEADIIAVTLPDGREARSDGDDLDDLLSRLTNRPIHLVRTPPPGSESERYWPDIDGLALRDTITSGAFGQGAPFGTFFDYAPLHLITTATLAHLQALYPGGQIDARRFRPNLVIHMPDESAEGFIENTWIGRALELGSGVRLRVTTPSPRCVVPTLPQGDLRDDIGVLRAIARHNRPPVPLLEGARMPSLGVYATVERTGVIHRDDTMHITS